MLNVLRPKLSQSSDIASSDKRLIYDNNIGVNQLDINNINLNKECSYKEYNVDGGKYNVDGGKYNVDNGKYNVDDGKYNVNGDEFQFGNISHDESDKFIKNISNDEKIIILYKKDEKRIYIKDKSNGILGSFNYKHIIKSILLELDHDNIILNDDDTCNKHSINLVKDLIGNFIKYNGDHKVILHDNDKSPLMGDLDILIRINNDLQFFEENELDNILINLDTDTINYFKYYIKLFIYTLLNYTLKLLSNISKQLINNRRKQTLADHILNYSIGNTYRLYTFTTYEIQVLNSKLNELHNLMVQSNNNQKYIDNKLTEVNEHVKDYIMYAQKETANSKIYKYKGDVISNITDSYTNTSDDNPDINTSDGNPNTNTSDGNPNTNTKSQYSQILNM
jgi:hypothetical protein